MRDNKLEVQIKKPIDSVFKFTITPPNSSLWIPGVVDEKTSEYPVKVGTIYTLTSNNGEVTKVVVSAVKENKFIEWESEDKIYHCRYTYNLLDKNFCQLEYYEWVDEGKIEEPFTIDVLKRLKKVIELEK